MGENRVAKIVLSDIWTSYYCSDDIWTEISLSKIPSFFQLFGNWRDLDSHPLHVNTHTHTDTHTHIFSLSNTHTHTPTHIHTHSLSLNTHTYTISLFLSLFLCQPKKSTFHKRPNCFLSFDKFEEDFTSLVILRSHKEAITSLQNPNVKCTQIK